MTTNWYVIRLKPGATREAPRRSWVARDVPDEAVVERGLREAGMACYVPRMKKDCIHHKTHAIVTRSFPLFTGYAFAGMARLRLDFPALRAAAGVAGVLGLNGEPWAVPASVVEHCRQQQADMVFDETREAKIRRKEIGRTRRETTAMMFAPGSAIRVAEGPFAGFNGQVTNVNGRGEVKALINLFGGLTLVDFDVGQIRKVA